MIRGPQQLQVGREQLNPTDRLTSVLSCSNFHVVCVLFGSISIDRRDDRVMRNSRVWHCDLLFRPPSLHSIVVNGSSKVGIRRDTETLKRFR